MNKYLRTCLLSAVMCFSITATAQEWVKAQLISAHSVENGAATSAKLANLSPAAIQKGLRDTQMLADVSFDESKRVLTYRWHSLVKEVKGTEYAQALTEPLTSQVKAPVNVGGINAGQELIAKGDIESLLADFDLLLAKAKEPTEVDASSSLNQETNNETDNRSNSSGGSSGGGFLGDNGNLTEQPEGEDLEIGTDKIIEKVEACSMKVDLTNMVVSEQERVVKVSSETGATVEVGECKSVGQSHPIRKDFEAGCTVKVDKETGEYIKGFKLYSMIEGSRYDISECEWENSDAISYDVMRDVSACPADKSVINVDRGTYNPAFVEYTMIDGKRYDLSECKTSDSISNPLPTKVEMCDNYNDLTLNVSFVRQRTDTYDPEFQNVLKSSNCTNIGIEYPIERDYEVMQCSDLPDYAEAKLFRGYRNFYTKEGRDIYLDGCEVDMADPIELFQVTGTCRPTENLTDRIATIKKRWAYNDLETNEVVYITDCLESEENYPIVTTENTCQPEYLADINKVIMKHRDGWQDDQGNWNYVTDCRASGDEADILTEICDSPKYEHDYVGGQSYLRSRDYYIHNEEKNYINSCSRDTSESFAHYKSTTGCTARFDDAHLRSQVYSKTMARLQEGETELKGCEAESQYIPYQFTGTQLVGKQTQSFLYSTSSGTSGGSGQPCSSFYPNTPYYGTIKKACDAMSITNTWGKNYTGYNPSSATSAKVNRSCSSAGYSLTFRFSAVGIIDADIKDWRRPDGSVYRQVNKYICQNE